MSFRSSLMLALGALIATFVLAVAIPAEQLFTGAFARVSAEALDGSAAFVTRTTGDQMRRMDLLLRPLESEPRLRAELASAVARGGRADELLVSLLGESSSPDEDLLLLISRDGNVAYGVARGTPVGSEVFGSRQVSTLLGELLDGPDTVQMLWSGPRMREGKGAVAALTGSLYVAAARKVWYRAPDMEPDLVGIVIIAKSFDAEFTDLGEAGVLFSDGEIPLTHTLRSTGEALAAARWLSATPLDAASASEMRPLDLEGASYYARPFGIRGMVAGPVRAAFFFSRKNELAARRSVRVGLLTIAAGLAIPAALVAFFLSNSVSRPVLDLARVAEKVRSGDLTARVDERRSDELGTLARRFNEMVDGLRERELAKEALGRYLSPEMARQLLSGQSRLGLEGEKRRLTILFSDIAGFTSLSENLDPQRLVDVLNGYLDRMVKILWAHGAYIDKFEGDAIMAFWGAPLEQPDHAVRACLAALDMRKEATLIAREWVADGLPNLGVRWGVNTGDVVVGNLGSRAKVNYTCIGDDVNLASRLEGANRVYGTKLLVGPATWEAARDAVDGREIDFLRVKGKENSVRIYEVLARRGELGETMTAVCERFAAGLALYRARKFDAARIEFERTIVLSGGDDGPARTFEERCRAFVLAPPPDDWDGTHEMRSK